MPGGWWEAVNESVREEWTSPLPPRVVLDTVRTELRRRRFGGPRLRARRRGDTLTVKRDTAGVAAELTVRQGQHGSEITAWVDTLGWSQLGQGVAALVAGLVIVVLTRGRSSGQHYGLGGLETPFAFAIPGYTLLMGGFVRIISLPGFPSQRKAVLRRIAEVLVAAGATFHAGAGWYDTGDATRSQRYWDGTAWTDRTRSTPPEEARTRVKVIAAQIAAVPLFYVFGFALLLGVPWLVSRNDAGHASLPAPAPVASVPSAVSIDLGPSDPTAEPPFAAIQQVATTKLRTLLRLRPDQPLSVRVTTTCLGCGRFELTVDAPVPLDPNLAAIALGSGVLTARPVVDASVPCDGVAAPWIPGAPDSATCVMVDAPVATLTVTFSDAEFAGANGGFVPIDTKASPELGLWAAAHRGTGVALVLDGRVLRVLDSSSASFVATDGQVAMQSPSPTIGAAVAAALSPPAWPR